MFDTIVQRIKPLDWPVFWARQRTLPLKVVASGLLSGKAVVMSAENGNFQTPEELSQCMKASMLLPGITGEAIRLKVVHHCTLLLGSVPAEIVCQGSQAAGGNIVKTWWRDHTTRRHSEFTLGSEPLTDAQLYEPIPYRSALRENCTHVVALRTKPDDRRVTAPMSVVERMIMSRFFGGKLGMPHLVSWMGLQVRSSASVLLFN